MAAGYRLEIHVIGDRAAEAALDALQFAQATPEQRHILTHCQVLVLVFEHLTVLLDTYWYMNK